MSPKQFLLLDGTAVQEPDDLIDLVFDHQGLEDQLSEHICINGVNWLFENTKLSDNRELDLQLRFIRGSALRIRSERLVGRSALLDIEEAFREYKDCITSSNGISSSEEISRMNANLAEVMRVRATRLTGMEAIEEIEASILLNKSLLDILNQSSFPEEHATIQMNLANSLSDRGERSSGLSAIEDFGSALSAYKVAYGIATKLQDTVFAAEIALNQGNLFLARSDLRTRNFSSKQSKEVFLADITSSISCFRNSLERQDENISPGLYCATMMGLATAHLTRAEQSIGSSYVHDMRHALRLLTSVLRIWTIDSNAYGFAQAQMNLGSIYADLAVRRQGVKAARSFGVALECYDRALEVWSLEADPQQRAKLQSNRARWLLELARNTSLDDSKAAVMSEAAKGAAKEMLSILSPAVNFPEWLHAKRFLSIAHSLLGEETECERILVEVLNEARGAILSAHDPKERTHLCHRISGAGDALALIRLKEHGDVDGAIEAIALGRGVQIGADLAIARLENKPDHINLRHSLKHLQSMRSILSETASNLARLYREMDEVTSNSTSNRFSDQNQRDAKRRATEHNFSIELGAAKKERDKAMADFVSAQYRYKSDFREAALVLDSAPSCEDLIQSLPIDTVVAFAIAGDDNDSGALLLLFRDAAGKSSSHWVELPDFNEVSLLKLLYGETWSLKKKQSELEPGWIAAYNDLVSSTVAGGGRGLPNGRDQENLNSSVKSICYKLWDLLMGPLDKQLRANGVEIGSQVVVSAPGRLSVLPLSAAAAKETSTVSEKPFFMDWAVSVAASPQAILAAAARIRRIKRIVLADERVEQILCVTTPSSLLPNSAADLHSRAIIQEIVGQDATPDAVCAALADHRHVVFLCHGLWDQEEPEQSGLFLAGPRTEGSVQTEKLLTMGFLHSSGANLDASRSWLLLACETAPVDLDAPDEFVGLAVRLSGEIPAVMGTLYPVLRSHADAFGRAVLALQTGPMRMSPAQSLRHAQIAAMECGLAGLEAIGREKSDNSPEKNSGTRASSANFRTMPGEFVGVPRGSYHAPQVNLGQKSYRTGKGRNNKLEQSRQPNELWPSHWAAYTFYGV